MIRYHQIQQKSLHNAFASAESMIAQFAYFGIRNVEWDLRPQPVESIAGPRLNRNDWYVYHSVHESRHFHQLSDGLRLLQAFHNAVPDHEVITLTLEFKGAGDAVNTLLLFDPDAGEDPTRETPAGLDALLRQYLGSALFTPADLLATCPSATTLQEVVKTCGWPSVESLKGKVIVQALAWNLTSVASTKDALDKYYAPSNDVANKRVAFAAPLDLWGDDSLMASKPWVVCHTEVNDINRAQAIRNNPEFSAHIFRSGEANDEAAFHSYQHYHNLIMTDHISFHRRPWARIHNQQGYPFAPIGVIGPDCWLGTHETSSLVESMNRLEIEVASGDIDHEHDSFAFAYLLEPRAAASENKVWSALITSASNKDVHGWAKGVIMVRENLSDSAAYYAVGVAGDNHEMFVQYRGWGCPGGPCGTDHTEASPSLGVGFDPEDAAFARLTLEYLPTGGVRVQGEGSADGVRWQPLGPAREFPVDLPFQGLAASSNEPNIRQPDGALTKFVFVNTTLNGRQLNGWARWWFERIGNTPIANYSDRSSIAAPPAEPCPTSAKILIYGGPRCHFLSNGESVSLKVQTEGAPDIPTRQTTYGWTVEGADIQGPTDQQTLLVTIREGVQQFSVSVAVADNFGCQTVGKRDYIVFTPRAAGSASKICELIETIRSETIRVRTIYLNPLGPDPGPALRQVVPVVDELVRVAQVVDSPTYPNAQELAQHARQLLEMSNGPLAVREQHLREFILVLEGLEAQATLGTVDN